MSTGGWITISMHTRIIPSILTTTTTFFFFIIRFIFLILISLPPISYLGHFLSHSPPHSVPPRAFMSMLMLYSLAASAARGVCCL